MPSAGDQLAHARTACLPCRKSKRRCDKTLPGCNLCLRKDVECRYPTRRGPDSPAQAENSPDSQNTTPSALSNSIYTTSDTDPSAIFFIAPFLFRQAGLELQRRDLPVPTDVQSQLGDVVAVRDIAVKFFIQIHRWFPIVSKRAFFSHLLNPLVPRHAEVSLLLLCMKLICTPPTDEGGQGGGRTKLYNTAKRFHQDLEVSNPLSIRVLQAGVILAVYELGQAIYPAAYLTVGACARYGLALGVDKLCRGTSIDEYKPQLIDDIEEGRRVWWGIMILDRFLSLSDPMRSLSTADPTFDTYLPVDDAAWDEGPTKPEEAVTIATGFILNMGSFARLAQATYLLSQALRAAASPDEREEFFDQDQTAQLRRTLLALVHAADREAAVRRLEFCAQSTLSLSTILMVQDVQYKVANSRPGHAQVKLTLDAICYEARTALSRLTTAGEAYNEACPRNVNASDNISIFLIHVMYQAACLYLTINEGLADGEMRGKVDTIKELLEILDPRWRLAGVYLRILEAHETMMAMDSIAAPQNIGLGGP